MQGLKSFGDDFVEDAFNGFSVFGLLIRDPGVDEFEDGKKLGVKI